MKHSIGVVIVLYNPDMNLLEKAIESLASQVDRIVLVDNSPTDFSDRFIGIDRLTYIPLMSNFGIAAAQNRGIGYLLKNDASDYIFLADQDSIWDSNIVNKLYSASQILDKIGLNPGIVAPLGISRLDGSEYPYSKSIQCVEFILGDEMVEAYEQRDVIASGSLIKTDAILQAGGMDESLFIDFVDREFCWRVTSETHLKIFVIPQIVFEHQIGQDVKRFFHKKIMIPLPIRHYYVYRNFLWLSHNSHMPDNIRKKTFLSLFKVGIYYSIVPKQCLKRMINIIKGLKDGIVCNYSPVIPFRTHSDSMDVVGGGKSLIYSKLAFETASLAA